MATLPDVNLRSHPDGGALFVAYVLDALAIFTGVAAIAGVIISHIKVREAENEAIKTHHRWLIRTFWWTIVWLIVLSPIAFFTFGMAYIVLWIWWVYRIVYGFLHFYENKPMPA